MGRNNNIQALRAIAALSVLLFHAVPFFEIAGSQLGSIKNWLGHGYWGVDLFFVISGFIIARNLRHRTSLPEIFKFAKRRAYRIYLGYWPVLAIATLYYFVANPERIAHINPVATLFLLSHHIPELIIGQAWSLSFEIFFYLLSAVLAVIGNQFARKAILAYSIIIIAINLSGDLVQQNFFFNPHLLELFAGTLLGQAVFPAITKLKLLFAGTLPPTLLYIWFCQPTPGPFLTVVLTGSASLVLVLIADALQNIGINPESWLSRLGDSSYALYLVHYLLLEVFTRHVAPIQSLNLVLPLIFCAWVAGVVFTAHIYYISVERPLYCWASAQNKPFCANPVIHH